MHVEVVLEGLRADRGGVAYAVRDRKKETAGCAAREAGARAPPAMCRAGAAAHDSAPTMIKTHGKLPVSQSPNI